MKKISKRDESWVDTQIFLRIDFESRANQVAERSDVECENKNQIQANAKTFGLQLRGRKKHQLRKGRLHRVTLTPSDPSNFICGSHSSVLMTVIRGILAGHTRDSV